MRHRLSSPSRDRSGGLWPARSAPVAGAVLPLLLLFLAAGGAGAAGIHLQYTPSPLIVDPGDTIAVEIQVNPGDAEFNAFDLFIQYDPAALTFLPTTPVSAQRGPLMVNACANTFHLFTPTVGNLQVNLSLLCNQVFVTGPGVIYKVRFIAGTTRGPTTIACGAGTQFYRAGFYVNPLDCTPMSITIGHISGVPEIPEGRTSLRLDSLRPNPWRAGGPAFVSFETDRPDEIRLELFDLGGRLRWTRPTEAFSAGRHTIQWAPPDLAPGKYFLRMVAASGQTSRAGVIVVD